MPQRPAVLQLPDELRKDLDRRLLDGGFSGYVGLSEWLNQQGYAISKSALHRYGAQFEERLGALKIATEQARAIAEAADDQENYMGDALIRLVQEKAFQVLMQLNTENIEDVSLPQIGRMIADLSRSSIQIKKYMSEVRSKAEKVATEINSSLKRQGLSDEAAAMIRSKVLGIAE